MRTVRVIWGQRIRAARIDQNISQVRLAAAMGVTQQVISKWETGISSPADDRRPDLARVLGVPPDELFAYPVNGGEEAA